MLPFLLGLALILALLSSDFSLQSSIAFSRSDAWWTAWFFKIGPLSVADWILVSITGYTIAAAVVRVRQRPLKSDYLLLCLLAVAYLVLGVAYNIFVFTHWKTYLYDFKVVLYLAIPFLFLHYAAGERIRSWFSPIKVFILAGTASVIDFVVVSLRGASEYPTYLGLPALLQLAPLPILLVGLVSARKPAHRWILAALLVIEGVSAINRLALGSIALAIVAIPFIVLMPRRMTAMARFLVVGVTIVGTNLLSVYVLGNPTHLGLLEAKAAGALTRQIEWDNVLLNYDTNFPIVIGKGLGTTWFQYIRIPAVDVYAVGTSVGDTPLESLASPVQFVFNFTAASLLYKWGFLGIVLLAYLLSRYYGRLQERYEALSPLSREGSTLPMLMMIGFILALDNFTYIGLAKAALMTSLIAFQIELRLPAETPKSAVTLLGQRLRAQAVSL